MINFSQTQLFFSLILFYFDLVDCFLLLMLIVNMMLLHLSVLMVLMVHLVHHRYHLLLLLFPLLCASLLLASLPQFFLTPPHKQPFLRLKLIIIIERKLPYLFHSPLIPLPFNSPVPLSHILLCLLLLLTILLPDQQKLPHEVFLLLLAQERQQQVHFEHIGLTVLGRGR